MRNKFKFKIFKKQQVGVPVPPQVYNYRIYWGAAVACFAACIIGYDAGFIGGTLALSSFQSEFGFDKMTAAQITTVEANVVSVFQAGAFFGALFMYPVGELLGRKVGLIISGFLLTFGAGITLISNEQRGLGAIYAGRVISGLGVGGVSGLTPIYVSEIAPPSIRGQLVGMYELSWQVGGIIGYWINYGVLQHVPSSSKQWQIPFAIQIIPSVLFWVGILFLPESPRWLMSVNKSSSGLKNLKFLRNLDENDPYLLYELAHIEMAIEQQAISGSGPMNAIKKIVKSKSTLYRLLLSTSLFPMQNGSGINAVTYYSPTVFKSLGISGSNTGLLSTGIFGIIKALASVFWMLFIVDNLGRRFAMFWGSFPCAFFMWYIGAYVKLSNPAKRLAEGNTGLTPAGKAALGFFYMWTFSYGLSWNGNPWVYNSEIFEQDIRTCTGSINAASNWFWAFIMGRFTGQAFAAMGYGVYFLFAGCMTVFPWIIFFFYPETKGVPLEAVDYLFERGVPAWRARAYALSKLEAEDENLPEAYGEGKPISEFIENVQT